MSQIKRPGATTQNSKMASTAFIATEFLFDSSSSSSSEDEEEENQRTLLPLAMHREDKPKVQGYVNTVVPLYNFDDFRRSF